MLILDAPWLIMLSVPISLVALIVAVLATLVLGTLIYVTEFGYGDPFKIAGCAVACLLLAALAVGLFWLSSYWGQPLWLQVPFWLVTAAASVLIFLFAGPDPDPHKGI